MTVRLSFRTVKKRFESEGGAIFKRETKTCFMNERINRRLG